MNKLLKQSLVKQRGQKRPMQRMVQFRLTDEQFAKGRQILKKRNGSWGAYLRECVIALIRDER